MLDKVASTKAIKRLFRRVPVTDLDTLSRTLDTKSRMSIFRRLKDLDYFSSYTHAGSFYTLAHIPQFDDYGLWVHQGIGFSKEGTLKATVLKIVETAPSGFTHTELNHMLRVKVHNTLLSLVREGCIRREHIEQAYLYISTEPGKAAEQTSQRRMQLAESDKGIDILPITTVIEVLIETIHAGKLRIAPILISQRLTARGCSVTTRQVEQVFGQYGIDTLKKTAELNSTRWQT
ncbi:MAG TPA: hypothetical protein HPP90_08435 [Deltaproteobacteria bacterium]|nr:hypothetical protein [Deltaproteobacteria bacterium]